MISRQVSSQLFVFGCCMVTIREFKGEDEEGKELTCPQCGRILVCHSGVWKWSGKKFDPKRGIHTPTEKMGQEIVAKRTKSKKRGEIPLFWIVVVAFYIYSVIALIQEIGRFS